MSDVIERINGLEFSAIPGEAVDALSAAVAEINRRAEAYATLQAENERLQLEIDRRHGIGGELIVARRERDSLRAENERLREALHESARRFAMLECGDFRLTDAARKYAGISGERVHAALSPQPAPDAQGGAT